jgi:hypothetical protein
LTSSALRPYAASDTLQHSLRELASLYPEDDEAAGPLSSYVQRQRMKSLEVLAARDAQARVEALLAGRQLIRSAMHCCSAAAAPAILAASVREHPLGTAVCVPLLSELREAQQQQQQQRAQHNSCDSSQNRDSSCVPELDSRSDGGSSPQRPTLPARRASSCSSSSSAVVARNWGATFVAIGRPRRRLPARQRCAEQTAAAAAAQREREREDRRTAAMARLQERRPVAAAEQSAKQWRRGTAAAAARAAKAAAAAAAQAAVAAVAVRDATGSSNAIASNIPDVTAAGAAAGVALQSNGSSNGQSSSQEATAAVTTAAAVAVSDSEESGSERRQQ